MAGFRSIKTQALVVGTMRLGEADRLVTLYTRERGRVSAVAKGVRRPLSRIGGRLEPFSLVHVLLHPGRSIYTVTGVDTIRSFQAVREELFRLEAGAQLCEAVRGLFTEEEANPAAFNVLVRGVAKLAGASGAGEVSVAVTGTIVKLLLVQGFVPDLAGCVACGTTEGLVGFGAEEGGILCSHCLETAAVGCFAVTDEGIRCLHDLVSCPLAELDPSRMEESGLREAERMARRLLAHYAGWQTGP
ncbi:MAG: DNA repair protein RecO [Gaiellales bacterium]|nr:DNA repair protein RecO [Gaiellales bacterium]